MADFTLAAVQAAPIYFDADKSIEKACDLIADAARKGATVAAFGETWAPGYPFFCYMPPAPTWSEASAAYLTSAITIPSAHTDKLCAAARAGGLDVVIGLVERDPQTHGTVYCTLLFISKEGVILGRHRKLKPTASERTIWGEGDATGLRTYARPYGRLSGLNCWEHNMGLPGYALAAQGTDIHVAAWPGGELPTPPAPSPATIRQTLLSRAFASMAASYVIAVGGLSKAEDMPEQFAPLTAYEAPGASTIIDPRGEIIAGPAEGETILLAEGSRENVMAAKAAFDVGGHYSRPDIFDFKVNAAAMRRVRFDPDERETPRAGDPEDIRIQDEHDTQEQGAA